MNRYLRKIVSRVNSFAAPDFTPLQPLHYQRTPDPFLENDLIDPFAGESAPVPPQKTVGEPNINSISPGSAISFPAPGPASQAATSKITPQNNIDFPNSSHKQQIANSKMTPQTNIDFPGPVSLSLEEKPPGKIERPIHGFSTGEEDVTPAEPINIQIPGNKLIEINAADVLKSPAGNENKTLNKKPGESVTPAKDKTNNGLQGLPVQEVQTAQVVQHKPIAHKNQKEPKEKKLTTSPGGAAGRELPGAAPQRPAFDDSTYDGPTSLSPLFSQTGKTHQPAIKKLIRDKNRPGLQTIQTVSEGKPHKPAVPEPSEQSKAEASIAAAGLSTQKVSPQKAKKKKNKDPLQRPANMTVSSTPQAPTQNLRPNLPPNPTVLSSPHLKRNQTGQKLVIGRLNVEVVESPSKKEKNNTQVIIQSTSTGKPSPGSNRNLNANKLRFGLGQI